MEFRQAQQVFRLLSYLLHYPDEEWEKGLRDCVEALEDIAHQRVVAGIRTFMEHARKQDPDERMKAYVSIFDFGKKTNMYMTYSFAGEQRERGFQLLNLKQTYRNAGFDVTCCELPDYLPLILEFSSLAEDKFVFPVLRRCRKNISEIKTALVDMNSHYAALFQVLLDVLTNIGIKDNPEERVEKTC